MKNTLQETQLSNLFAGLTCICTVYFQYQLVAVFLLNGTFNGTFFVSVREMFLNKVLFVAPNLPCNTSSRLSHRTPYLLVKSFPVILCHQSKQREERPTKGVKAGVIVVWVPSHSDAKVPLWTLPATNTECVKLRKKQKHSYKDRCIRSCSSYESSLPSLAAVSTKQWISFAWKVIMIF